MGNTSPLPGQTHVGQLSAARGLTPYLPLKDHKITFNFPLEAIVKMDVTRGSGNAAESTHHHEPHEGVGGLNPNDPHSQSNASVSSMAAAGSLLQQQQLNAPKPNIHPSPLKLVVMQRVIPDDPSNSPQNPRLGEVVLNLAEYVGKGKVERRFLLKESRVNAMLKVCGSLFLYLITPLLLRSKAYLVFDCGLRCSLSVSIYECTVELVTRQLTNVHFHFGSYSSALKSHLRLDILDTSHLRCPRPRFWETSKGCSR